MVFYINITIKTSLISQIRKRGRLIDTMTSDYPLSADYVPQRDKTSSNLEEQTLEEKLRRTEVELERYRTLYESIPSIYFTLNTAGVVVSINKFGAVRLGYTEGQLKNKSIFDLVVPQEQAKLRTTFTNFSQASILIENWKFHICCKDGSILWLKAVSSKLSEEIGDGVVGIDKNLVILNCEDISNQKWIEADWERFFTLSIDLLAIGSFDGYFKCLNPAWEKVTQFSREELLSKPFIEFVHPEDRGITQVEMQQIIAGVDMIAFENRYCCKDGSIKWFSWKAKTSVEEQLIYAVARDITHQKHVEAELQQSNEQIIHILESTNDVCFALDCQWRFTYINSEAEQLLPTFSWRFPPGATLNTSSKNREELIGKCIWDEFSEAFKVKCYPEYHKAVSEQVVVKYEEFNPQLKRWFAVYAYPTGAGLTVYFNDITDQKQAESATTAQLEELAELNRLKDEFLSTVSHELRTPLTNIKMATQMLAIAINQQQPIFSEMAKPQAERSRIARYFHVLHEECEREINLIDDILALQQLEVGNQPLDLAIINLESWLHKVAEPFQARVRNRNQTLQINISAALPPLISEASSLERLLVELLDNACKYTPPEEHITLSAIARSQTFQLKVNNTGVEIPATEFSRIFDKFYRVPSTDPWKQRGTGLGLALAKKLAEHLRGKIWVESALEQTCFTVELPSNTNLHSVS